MTERRIKVKLFTEAYNEMNEYYKEQCVIIEFDSFNEVTKRHFAYQNICLKKAEAITLRNKLTKKIKEMI